MPKHSRMHAYVTWAKERLDEMDAALASLEVKAARLTAESRVKGDRLIADLKKRREEFKATVQKQAEAGEAAWRSIEAQLESQWSAFEAQVKAYFAAIDRQFEQQQVTFRNVSAAQVKAWHDAAETLHESALKLAAARRADVDAAVKEMKTGAAEAEARLQKLKVAQHESWTALSAALAESRTAFDHANRKAWEAFHRAAS